MREEKERECERDIELREREKMSVFNKVRE